MADALIKDANNRTARTFLQGLGIDVLVGISLVFATFFVNKNSWGEIEWTILTFSLAKSVVQAIAAYVMRVFIDGSPIPTPLPPEDPGDPVGEDTTYREVGGLHYPVEED